MKTVLYQLLLVTSLTELCYGYYKPAIPPKNGGPSGNSRGGGKAHNIIPRKERLKRSGSATTTALSSSSSSTATPPSTQEKTTSRILAEQKKMARVNPKSDRFKVLGFHHVEFYCGDATNTFRRFQLGLGMNLVAKSDLSTGNQRFASYCLQSNDLKMVFTAPYLIDNNPAAAVASSSAASEASLEEPNPGFDAQHATDFFKKHGMAVRAIGIEVSDATKAYEECIRHGGQAALAPVRLNSPNGSSDTVIISEVRAYGDVVIRFVSREGGFDGPYLPAYQATPTTKRPLNYGLQAVDHAVGNVWNLLEAVGYVGKMMGFHEFAEFTADDVGTLDSGLNSVVLANNNENVLIPLNEPTYGTKRKSQIQTYLEYNNGPGLQHLALRSQDIFSTIKKMKEKTDLGGFEFMERPVDAYYRDLPSRIGDSLTADQYKQVEELGLLVDKDDQGILLQVFTKPVGDRPTLFLEIIQRIGCQETDLETGKVIQRGGCGGFGKGNFRALFQAIEKYEESLKLN